MFCLLSLATEKPGDKGGTAQAQDFFGTLYDEDGASDLEPFQGQGSAYPPIRMRDGR